MRCGALFAAAFPLLWAVAAHSEPAGGFKHVIVIVQENRTPDNIFGSMPNFEVGVDVRNFGTDSSGKTVKLTAEPFKGCYDIAHTHLAFTQMYAKEDLKQDPLDAATERLVDFMYPAGVGQDATGDIGDCRL